MTYSIRARHSDDGCCSSKSMRPTDRLLEWKSLGLQEGLVFLWMFSSLPYLFIASSSHLSFSSPLSFYIHPKARPTISILGSTSLMPIEIASYNRVYDY